MLNDNIGFQEDPRNSYQIQRSRTSGNIRAWDFPRNLEVIDIITKELGPLPYPGLYILFDNDDKTYVGEAGNVLIRIKTHMQNPSGSVEFISDWNRGLIINDGRPATQSDLNDIVVRRSLENYLRDLLRDNNYDVVSQASEQNLTAIQKHVVDTYIEEFNVLLMKKGVIDSLLDDITIREVYLDDLQEILEKKGIEVQELGAHKAILDGKKYYVRTGSKKSKGFQITFRARFLESLENGEDNLLVNRDGILMMPLSAIRNHLDDREFDKVTVDIFVRFDEDKTVMLYHDYEWDVSGFILNPIDYSSIRELDSDIELYDVDLTPHEDDIN